MMTGAVKISQECAAPNDALIFYNNFPKDEPLFEVMLSLYLYDVTQPQAQVDAMLNLLKTNAWDLGFNYPDTWQERLEAMIEPATSVWYIARKDLRPIESTERFLQQMPTFYANSTVIVDTPTYSITQFSNAPSSCTLNNSSR
jgi:hypothetical protein